MANNRRGVSVCKRSAKAKTTCQTNNLLTEATAPGAAAMKAAITAEMKRSFIFEIAMCFGFDVCFLLCKSLQNLWQNEKQRRRRTKHDLARPTTVACIISIPLLTQRSYVFRCQAHGGSVRAGAGRVS